jgi:hypothetical protein
MSPPYAMVSAMCAAHTLYAAAFGWKRSWLR